MRDYVLSVVGSSFPLKNSDQRTHDGESVVLPIVMDGCSSGVGERTMLNDGHWLQSCWCHKTNSGGVSSGVVSRGTAGSASGGCSQNYSCAIGATSGFG